MRQYTTATKASIIAGAVTATLLYMPTGSASATPLLTVEKSASEAFVHSSIVSDSSARAASVTSIIKEEFKGTANDARAVALAKCLSGLNPKASNPYERFYGLFQLSKRLFQQYYSGSVSMIFDARQNSRVAYKLFAKYGWAPLDSPGC